MEEEEPEEEFNAEGVGFAEEAGLLGSEVIE